MSTAEIFVYLLSLLGYSILSVFIIRKFRRLISGVIGCGCLIGGSIALYFLVPTLLGLILTLLKVFFGLLLLIALVTILIDLL